MRVRGKNSLPWLILLIGAALIGGSLTAHLGGSCRAQGAPSSHEAPGAAEETLEHGTSGDAGHDEGARGGAAHAEDALGEESHGAPAHGGEGQGAGAHGGGHEGAPHLPTIITILSAYHGDARWVQILKRFEDVIFAALAALILGLTVHAAYRRISYQPGRLQSLIELAVEGLNNLVCGILGKEGRRYVPFVGTLFLYILIMNLMGLVPFLKSPTSQLHITASMAICVFLYVQYTGLRNFGIVGYLDHLAGSPRDPITWALVPIMIPLHVIGELAKPLSLSLRLFGNITGEDILLAVFVGLGAASLHFTHLPIGLPFQVPLIFLAILTSIIQALVFTLLSTVYFLMMQRHEEEH